MAPVVALPPLAATRIVLIAIADLNEHQKWPLCSSARFLPCLRAAIREFESGGTITGRDRTGQKGCPPIEIRGVVHRRMSRFSSAISKSRSKKKGFILNGLVGLSGAT